MGCKDKTAETASTRTREVIAPLFERGNVKAAFSHRLFQCTHATGCGRLCERLVKAPGKASVTCVDVTTGGKTDLYAALENPEFECPKGLF